LTDGQNLPDSPQEHWWAFPLGSWLLVTVWRMLRRNQRRFSQRLKWRKIQRKYSRNPKRKIQRR
jgi:hypothetical protein